jgi:hypothetical protein
MEYPVFLANHVLLVVMVHTMMMEWLVVVRVWLMGQNALKEKIVICVVPMPTTGTQQEKCNVDMSPVTLMANCASLDRVAPTVAVVEHMMVMELFVVVHVYLQDLVVHI